ncbi:DegV family protein [Caldisalinibacter kiritimatiensis]|uniref:DegV family protein n=1 Tax=Caldisalinibacter kiritimatiensis TaxID=1304284 RepID=R1CXR2_9FIRM|nr:DegV family protein [Caldisalinibacter kiritimatiensis]EOD01394.1 DegV family protein [Caldisalinibacter kiritimatiensis]
MANIKIITDSTAYIEKEYAENNGIGIVPLSINFEGNTNKEGFPGEFKDFYNKLVATKDFPTTSQPAIGEFVKVFEEEVKKGNEVIAILISEKLSGTYNTAVTAANMVAPEKISVIDSETTVSNLRLLVQQANELAKEGKMRKEILNIINEQKKKSGINLTVETLEYLKRGGRLSGKQALVGNVLNIKPIIALIDGKLESISKVRGKKRAIKKMISNIPEVVESISVCHILNKEEAEKIKNKLKEKFPNAKISIDEIGPVIGSHLGPKALGICYSW